MSLKLYSGIGNRKTPCTDKIISGLIPYLPREKRWERACREQMGSYSLALVGGHTREIPRDQTQVSPDGRLDRPSGPRGVDRIIWYKESKYAFTYITVPFTCYNPFLPNIDISTFWLWWIYYWYIILPTYEHVRLWDYRGPKFFAVRLGEVFFNRGWL